MLPSLMAALSVVHHAGAPSRRVAHGVAGAGHRARSSPLRLLGSPDGPLGSPDDAGDRPPEDQDAGVADFRAQLLRQMMGGRGGLPTVSDRERLMRSVETATVAEGPAAGVVLLADPSKFCSKNPFARPVKELGRFGLDGPVILDELPPDIAAQMLPVVLLLEHGAEGSFGVLLERRTGALMGDIDINSFGCVAIAPLWLGGTQRQNSLSVVHPVEGLQGATSVCEGLWLGGWEAAKPRVSDSSLSGSRFKFYLGGTVWGKGQLAEELASGAWCASPRESQPRRARGLTARPLTVRSHIDESLRTVARDTVDSWPETL